MHPLVRELGARLRSFVRSPHTWGVLATIAVVGILFLLPHGAQATAAWESYIAGALAWVLGLIVNFLGKIISVLIYILMGFLQYNDFANAPPVMMGWVIIRDLMNMVFIVVLIISAVATILNYETSDLHVKNVLPKLIAAAVLINFSKMIVGILIDVSQVVMLTFVNAFQASGVGNFSQLLGLPSFTQLNSGDGTTAAASATPTGAGAAEGQIILDVLLAYMLAMAMLVISIGVILIMILFTIARIVGIWVLLIISPAAFLASSLPKKLQKIFGSLAHDFWEKLTAFLVGGPTMAFFLWLAFATVRSTQQMTAEGGVATRLKLFDREASPITRNGIYSANSTLSGAAQQGTNAFLSRVGNADGIASFIVGIALMLIGLEQATRAAGAASATLGKYAGSIASGAKGAASWIANRPVRAAAGTWNAFDRRLKVTDKAASALALVPGLNALSGGKIGGYVNYRKKELAKMAKDDLELHGNMSGIFQKAKAGSMKMWSKTPFPIRTDADVQAYAGLLKKDIGDSHHRAHVKEKTDEYEKEFAKSHPNLSKEEIKSMAKSRAQTEGNKERSEKFKEALSTFDKAHDTAAVIELQDQADKNPLLWSEDEAKFQDAVKRMSDDDIEKASPELMADGKFMTEYLKNKKALKFSPDGTRVEGVNASAMADLQAKFPKHASRFKGVESYVNGSLRGGGTLGTDQLRGAAVQDYKNGKGGNARLYNGSTGDRMMSTAEGGTRAAIGASARGANNGRNDMTLPPEQRRLTGAAATQVREAVGLGMALNEVQDLFNDEGAIGVGNADQAAARVIAEDARTELNRIIALGAGANRAQTDAGMKSFTTMASQFGNLDGKSKAALMGEMSRAAGDITEFMAANYEKIANDDKQAVINFIKAVREQADRNTATLRTSPPGTISADEAAANTLYARFQAAFPKEARKQTTTTAAGVSTETILRNAAVEPIAKSLYS